MNLPYLNYTLINNKSELNFIKTEVDNLANSITFYAFRDKYGHSCPRCNSKHHHIDDKRCRKVIFPRYNGMNQLLIINHNRFKCVNCKKKFVPPFECVDRNKKISKESHEYFKIRAKSMHSIKSIAFDCGVSDTTAWSWISNITLDIDLNGITGLFFDEFKGNADGERYQLSIYDQDYKLVTVLKDRKQPTIKGFLELLDLSKIGFVCTDLYKPFKQMIQKLIPNVTYIADKYHFIRQITWAIRDRRLFLYNSDKIKFKKCKTYWRLLAKNPLSSFSDKQNARLEEILGMDKVLKSLYEFQTAFRVMCETKNGFEWQSKSYDYLLTELLAIGSPESHYLHNTLKNWQREIINANLTGKSNGFVEGYNNKTKVLKRVSYGLRKFNNLNKLMHLRFNSRATIVFGN